MKLSCKVQFLMLITKMQFVKRFPNFAQHNWRLKFQFLIAIDKKF